ncbi:MAG: hypothetical protein ABMA64_04295 [Myxococcota bacterium]
MKLRLAVCLGSMACDDTGFELNADTGLAFDPLRGDTTFLPGGGTTTSTSAVVTQVGSEGFWGCTQQSTTPIPYPDQTIEALGGSPAAVVGARAGGWTLAIVDLATGAALSGALELVDPGQYAWVDVDEATGCVDHLLAAVTATVTHDADAPFASAGWLAVRRIEGVDQGAVALTSSASAEIPAAWAAPAGDSGVDPVERWFRIDAAVEPSSLAGAAGWAACGPATPGCADVQVVAELSAAR